MGSNSNRLRTVSLGLIGGGRVAEAHINGLRLLYGAGRKVLELRAICSRTRARAEELAEKVADFQGLHPRIYCDYVQLAHDPEISAVTICTAHDTHHTIGQCMLNSGKHCLIEKPLALTIQTARQLVEVAEQNRLLLATAENYRRQPRFRTLKWILEQHLLGDIITVILLDSAYGNRVIDDTPWRHSKKHAGPGQMLDRGSHHADLFEYLLGPVERVYGYATLKTPERYVLDIHNRVVERVSCDAEDTFYGLLHFASGATGLWYLSSSGHGKPLEQQNMMLMGTKGSFREDELVLDEGKWRTLQDLEQEMLRKLTDFRREAWFPGGITDDFAIELHDFALAVAGQGTPEVDGKQGLRAMALSYAICESSLLGRPVAVADVEEGRVAGYQRELDRALGLESSERE